MNILFSEINLTLDGPFMATLVSQISMLHLEPFQKMVLRTRLLRSEPALGPQPALLFPVRIERRFLVM